MAKSIKLNDNKFLEANSVILGQTVLSNAFTSFRTFYISDSKTYDEIAQMAYDEIPTSMGGYMAFIASGSQMLIGFFNTPTYQTQFLISPWNKISYRRKVDTNWLDWKDVAFSS